MMFERQHQHPALILLSLIQSLKEMLIPIIFLIYSALKDDTSQWWPLIGFFALILFVLTSSFLRWLRFYYDVTEREVRIEYGIFTRKRRYIPFERIQTINLTQGIIHRMFGLVKLQIETAGSGDEPEAQLQALSRDKAERLREWIRAQKEKSNIDAFIEEKDKKEQLNEEIDYEFKLSKKTLIIAASTSGGFGVLFSFIGALFTQIDNLLPENFFSGMLDALISLSIFFIVIAIFFVALIAWLVSIVNTVFKFGGFVLKKKRDELQIERGILEKRQVTIPINKVQAVRIEEGLFRQPFQLAAIYVDIAGESGSESDLSTVINPLIHKKDVMAFLNHVLPTFAQEIPFQSVPKRSRRRYIIRSTWFYIPLIGAAFWFLPKQFAIASLLLLLFGIVSGWLKHRDAGWFLKERTIGVRFRRWGRTTVLTHKKRIQSFEKDESFLQRRKKLATFHISVLGGLFGNTFTVQDMELEKADDLFHQLRRKRI
ncbi:hypothetical protein DCC39_16540 [Pueribacillus theae]|uniref:YdbS-like PH domain-containing protein n=1 Tax=Pueribacillus theae TaxID=2171751 RepID=A0A2U1JRL8_9BACI|nr:PH domain-containing protein [Pueribacillus theae]PWA07599.1 hypothetical protein DCC39_16540 [Pueribacillus theae]